MAETKFGTFEELLAMSEESQRETAVRLRALILAIHPEAVEVVRLGDRAATFGLGPKKMSEGYCYVLLYKSWVNLGFFYGVELPDPHGLLQGTGKKLRHIKVRSLVEAERPELRPLIEAALAERKVALGR